MAGLNHEQSQRLGQRSPRGAAGAVVVETPTDLPENGFDGQIAYTKTPAGAYIFNDTTDTWVSFCSGGGGAQFLDDLEDVVVDGTQTDRQLLAYDAGTSLWKPHGPIVHHGTSTPEAAGSAASRPWRFYVKHV